jgi:ATP-dependent protease Clp ATPase subunit
MFWKRRLACSFCRRPDSEVDKLVAGPRRVYICDRCVAIAADIMNGTHVGPTPHPRTAALARISAAIRRLSGRAHLRTALEPSPPSL